MEIPLTPETEKKLHDLAAQSGRTTAGELVQDVFEEYFGDLAHGREMLDRRFDDLEDGRVKPIPGEEVIARLGAKSGNKNPSDLRLKTDVRRIGTAAHGLPLYTFRYIGQDGLYEGVMAQDVLEVMPAAVSLGEDGHYRVDYALLGIPFRRLH